MTTSRCTSRDACVVNTDGLASVVTGFVREWELAHPRATGIDARGYEAHGRNASHDELGRFQARDPDAPLSLEGDASAIAVLSDRTRELALMLAPRDGGRILEGLDGEIVQETSTSTYVPGGISPATIRRIVKVQHRHTELRIADQIVSAARRPFAFYDGTLTVEGNPYVDPATRATCCGSPGIAGQFFFD